MNLHNLTKVTTPSAKRLGRGIGSGRGKTSGRGMKGQKSRGKIPAANVGAGLIYFKKLPYRRGWGNSKVSVKPSLVRLEKLNVFKAGDTVSTASLVEQKLVTAKASKMGIKIVSGGQFTAKNIIIEVPVTASVRTLIEQSGGKIV
jgi:large subunit ribosomal protein L15